jgi:hypothetical protein
VEAGTEARVTDDFYRGVAAALTVIAHADQETLFREVVACCGERELLRVAKRDGVLRLSGFTKYGYRYQPAQLNDTPEANEKIVVYEMVEGTGPRYLHVNRRGAGGSGIFYGADYQLVSQQPTDEQLRSTTLWREWVASKAGQPIAEDGTIARSAE